jgi:hypothetical protein
MKWKRVKQVDFFKDWEQDLYDRTFGEMYDALIAQYKAGLISESELERNIREHRQIIVNSCHEGERKQIHDSAVLDAHEFALSLIRQGKLPDPGADREEEA